MTWPFVSRRVHDVEMAALARELSEARQQAAYWRARAELFIDRAAARAGLTHEPVMRPVPEVPIDPFAGNPFAGVGISVIDSTREDGRARN